jgi:hypothetical protein
MLALHLIGPEMQYTYKTIPYNHQKTALQKARLPDRRFRPAYAYFMEMGTGKTKVMIDEMCQMYLEGAITLAIIFAPKGVYLNWPERELPVHMPDDIYKESDIIAWNEGGKGYEYRLQKLFKKDGRFKVFFINIESLSMSKKARDFLKKLMKEHAGRILTAIDESTTIKNPDSKRTEAAVELGKLSTFRRIMTGSPVTRSPLDLYSQFEFLGDGLLGFGSFYAFRARYAVLKDMKTYYMKNGRQMERKFKVVVNYRNIEDLNEKIQPHSYRVLKEQCLDLPPKVYIHREVEMTEEQERIYQDVLSKASASLGQEEICYQCEGTGVLAMGDEGDFICAVCQGTGKVRGGDTVTVQQVITKILRLHQVLCGHVMDENGVVHDIPSNRVDSLMQFLEETSGRGIIWCKYRRDIENVAAAIEKVYGPGAAVQYHGGVDRAGRETASYRFQGRKHVVRPDRSRYEVICPDNERATYMISNPQTGGYGNTWTEASWEAYFSNDYDLEKRLQSEDRAHRAGQTKSVTICDFYVPRTVEAKIIKALRNKIDISTAIMGDGYREWLV